MSVSANAACGTSGVVPSALAPHMASSSRVERLGPNEGKVLDVLAA